MIQRFNFYDIYGYFLPGLTFLALIWLPFILVEGNWPIRELVAALVTIPVGYIAGHLLQTLAVTALPSDFKDSQGKRRFPSDVVLDVADGTFSDVFKQRIGERIKAQFGIDVNAPGATSKERQDAFFLCRSALIKGKSASYGEQFQGMYALMRGLTVAFGAGSAYHVGWALGEFKSDCIRIVAVLALVLGLLVAFRTEAMVLASSPPRSSGPRFARRTLRSMMIALISTGYLLGYANLVKANHWQPLLGAAAANFFAALKCWGGYKYFAKEFAKAIYRDFCAFQATAEGMEEHNGGNGLP